MNLLLANLLISRAMRKAKMTLFPWFVAETANICTYSQGQAQDTAPHGEVSTAWVMMAFAVTENGRRKNERL